MKSDEIHDDLNTIHKTIGVVFCLYLIGFVAFWAVIAWIAWHFISKFW